MNAAKHTPGPWSRNIKPASKYCTIFAGQSTHVAVVCTQGLTEDEIEANTDLIAAAPDLLAALKWAMDYISLHEGRNDKHAFCVNNCLHKQARAAIARAEGRGGQP